MRVEGQGWNDISGGLFDWKILKKNFCTTLERKKSLLVSSISRTSFRLEKICASLSVGGGGILL